MSDGIERHTKGEVRISSQDIKPDPSNGPTGGGHVGDDSRAAWHALTLADLGAHLRSDPQAHPLEGLPSANAAMRLKRLGRNELEPEEEEPWWKEAFEALTEPLVLLLVAVGVLYAVFGRLEDAITIFVVIVAVSAVETITEARAKRAIKSLAALAAPEATVIRDGEAAVVPTWSLVPGDLVVLDAGSRVPADLRLVSTTALRVDESSLTGESVPVGKNADAVLPADTSLGDRVNMAFMGTAVTAGQGRGLVVATGPETEVGHIAALARSASEPRTPLQQHLRQLAAWLVWLAVGFSVLVPVLSVVIGGVPWRESLLEGLTLAFATIPEELPILITIVLGMGAYRLAKEHAIVKRLQAAETLGSVSVIGTDKTGTLTENRMHVADVFVDGHRRPINGRVAESSGDFGDSATTRRLLEIGAIATGAQVTRIPGEVARFIGDPTDTSLLAAAQDAGVLDARDRVHILAEFPFDDLRKRIAAIYERSDQRGGARNLERDDGESDERWLVLKGAPEHVLDLCRTVRIRGEERPLDEAERTRVMQAVNEMATSGERVVAFAERKLGPEVPLTAAAEVGLTLVGLAGLDDPPRAEAAEAIGVLTAAGVRVVMITGDHPATARAIARLVGIDTRRVVTGADVEHESDERLRTFVSGASVFARITPKDKLRLVEALQANGEIVAVMGDGVNDAPALRQAAIGIAMGKRGTDVAREAADVVLSDDNFATVPIAVRGGRVLFENLRKAVRYYLAAKVGLITASLVAVLVHLPLPFAPVQIIVLELFMDLGASTTFVAEPPEGDVMARPPRDPRRRFMDRSMVWGILGGGLSLGAAVLVAYIWAQQRGLGVETARTAAFAAWMIGHIMLAIHMRSEREPLIRRGLKLTRPFVIWAVGAIGLAIVGPLVPFLSRRLYLTPLPAAAWTAVVLAAVVLPSWWEPAKWMRLHSSGRVSPPQTLPTSATGE